MAIRIAPTIPNESVFGMLTNLFSKTDLESLWANLPEYLAPFIQFGFLNLTLYDECFAGVKSLLAVSHSSNSASIDVLPADSTSAMPDPSAKWWIGDCAERPSCLPHLKDIFTQHHVQSYCSVPVAFDNRSFGILTLGSEKLGAYVKADAELLSTVCAHLAMVIACAIAVEEGGVQQSEYKRENDILVSVREVFEAVVTELNLHQLLAAVSRSIQRISGAEYSDLLLHDPVHNTMRRLAVSFGSSKCAIQEGWVHPVDDTKGVMAFKLKVPFVATKAIMEEEAKHYEQLAKFLNAGLQEFCCVPLINRGKCLGTLNVGSLQAGRFTESIIELLAEISKPVAVAVENALIVEELTNLKEKLAREKMYLECEIKANSNFEEIVGESHALQMVLEQVAIVAETDATVLILGETGTGKELVARAIHDLSTRKSRTFVKLNCAAVPTGLLESELFGYEKGAFTGATASKMGLMELAHNGTLFLDEVGDIPIEVQPKLLRAIQEGEFSRLGSTRTVKVDVRLIAATNRNLRQLVEERQFRNDLYYRLNVFPITIPPLRERPEDIPLLVNHFTRKFAKRRNRRIDSVPSESMDALIHWSWPGNVRELENLIERAVILSKGPALFIPLKDLQEYRECSAPVLHKPETVSSQASDPISADVILRTLKETNGIVGGPRGAAIRLGLKRTTLLWKMHNLGISPRTESDHVGTPQ